MLVRLKLDPTPGLKRSDLSMDQAYREIGMRNGTDVKTTQAFYKERGLESQLQGDILEGKARNYVATMLAAQNAPAPEVEASSAAE